MLAIQKGQTRGGGHDVTEGVGDISEAQEVSLLDVRNIAPMFAVYTPICDFDFATHGLQYAHTHWMSYSTHPMSHQFTLSVSPQS
jgi:hypothetical protein